MFANVQVGYQEEGSKHEFITPFLIASLYAITNDHHQLFASYFRNILFPKSCQLTIINWLFHWHLHSMEGKTL